MELSEVSPTYDDVNDWCRAYWDEVPKVAARLYRETGVSEVDDIAQAIWEGVIRNFDADLAGEHKEQVVPKLKRYGRNFVWQESLDYQYFSGNYIYTPGDVRQFLEPALTRDPETLSEVEYKIDLKGAYESLTTKRQKALYKRYAEGVRPKDMSKAEQRAIDEGVDAMCNYLNKKANVKAVRLDADGAPGL